ncbi:hypothetical protein EL22_25380 [Halostagnicola sp. A56]|uniref:hypothetical protein n=1 Tax=Halostagnicola sp. A56 TaxID=1495067 RepID=UPI0004A09B96|nr:hypothetical protein [Halostagnicola sp. A56]KDE56703.1 hypothetical protein EL22_25380 [Halostagnicola sp. A56]
MNGESSDGAEGWAHGNEFVTIVDEEHDGWGVGVWNKTEGVEIVEFNENGELVDGIPLFTDEDIQSVIDTLEETLEIDAVTMSGKSSSGTNPQLICEDCGESPILVSLDGGVDYGVECKCERSDGTPIGSYVDLPGRLPEAWSMSDVDTEHVTEARRMAMRTIEDWTNLSDDEKFGTLHQIVDRLSKAEADRQCEPGNDQTGGSR